MYETATEKEGRVAKRPKRRKRYTFLIHIWKEIVEGARGKEIRRSLGKHWERTLALQEERRRMMIFLTLRELWLLFFKDWVTSPWKISKVFHIPRSRRRGKFSWIFLRYFLSNLILFWMYSRPLIETERFSYIFFTASISLTIIFTAFTSEFFSTWISSMLTVGCAKIYLCGELRRGGLFGLQSLWVFSSITSFSEACF